jgi:hypothetical protein
VTTGALFGAVAALFVVPGLIELSANVQRRLIRRREKEEEFGPSR